MEKNNIVFSFHAKSTMKSSIYDDAYSKIQRIAYCWKPNHISNFFIMKEDYQFPNKSLVMYGKPICGILLVKNHCGSLSDASTNFDIKHMVAKVIQIESFHYRIKIMDIQMV